MQTCKFTVDAEGIAVVEIDVPGRSMNVLTTEFFADLGAVVTEAAENSRIKGVILTSARPGVFTAGADIHGMAGAFDNGATELQGMAVSQTLSRLMRRLETSGKPFVCAMNGLTLGGGLELALACHYRVLAANASVGLPEVTIGLLPGAGGTQRLSRVVGIDKALPLLLTGQQVKAADALKLGIVHAVVGAEHVVAKAHEWLLGSPSAIQPWDVKGYQVPGGSGPGAASSFRNFVAGTALVAQSTQRNYPAPLAILSCVYEGTQVSIDVALRIESKYFGKLFADPVSRNMMRTLFVTKRAADKLSRRPTEVAKSSIRKVGILGAGMMGAGIAYVSAAAGIEVALLDTTLTQAEKGKGHSAKLLEKSVTRGSMTQEQSQSLLSRIQPTTDYADLADCDLVIEAVFEDRAVKAEVTRKAAAAMSANAWFGSNTSTLPITGLAEAFSRPSDFIGLHFFSPVDRMPLVEVILGRKTSKATLARALDYVAQLRKTPIVVNDGPGFFTSRVFSTYTQEAIVMLDEGVAPALIENAARQAGFPVGPLAIGDEVSLALQIGIIEQNLRDGQPATAHLERVLAVLHRMVDTHGRSGRRGGGGYYDYPADGKKHLWTELSRHFPQQSRQPAVTDVKERLLYIQALEAARCLEGGVIEHAQDADLGSVLGIGFPSWTGGVVSFIDTVGLPAFVANCERLADRHGERFRPSAWLKRRAQSNQRFYSTDIVSAA